MSVNRVILIGRLVRDPELRTTNTGKSIASFSIAVDKKIKPQDGSATADFFRCKAWGQGATFLAEYGGKGRLVAVDGRLETSKFTDKEGQNREIIEIVADNVNLLDRAKDDGMENIHKYSTAKSNTGATTQGEWDPFEDE